ncbi:SLOG family protein [Alkalicoccus urumqiensis]|uniref:DUF1273 domain-containing protein n=1 Tax=Alkalicoccus urumqiensis TaxID=1548213 RepID=A0A2P6MDR8_ALKUR|nr:SLOG family protein [Alkalicoccus urumqiensis]PRO64429.1 hypothetical protein C6I21_14605 [Alkalicoccus urumqiensis]
MYRVLAVSGYKPNELGIFQEKHDQLPWLKQAIKKKLEEFIQQEGTEWIVTSGQPGVELWAGEAAIELKQEGYPVQTAVIAPFTEQDARFPDPVKQLYDKVWSQCDYHDFITKRPYESPAQLRLKNEFLVSKTDALLLLYDEEMEGSPRFFLQAAEKKKDYPVLYLTPEEIEDKIRDMQDDWN